MCGISAYFRRYISYELIEYIKECSLILKKRGPDSEVIVLNDGLYIFYRLSINDLSEAGNQPMFLDGVMLMCNGQIYNSNELIRKYNIKCKSTSDCEVILHLYKLFGFSKTISLLDGVYAIVLKDKSDVYIARDRIGVRPLYYGMKDGYLAVASIPNVLKYCDKYTYFPPGLQVKYNYNNATIRFKNILKPIYQAEIPTIEFCDMDNGIVAINKLLTEAVKKRLLTDRPFCCLLSGGLDSSIITYILCELIGSENVNTFSIGMEGSTDMKYAKLLASELKTNHTEVLFTPQQGLDIIPEIIQNIATYDITTIRASVGMYLISRYISQNTDYKVLFSGEGSDELFQGYLYFHNAPSESSAKHESRRLVNNLHQYDVLRSDRTVSCHGLELRVPFLDYNFVNHVYSIRTKYKMVYDGYEKYILRKAFPNLPKEILYRRKEGFSDGVSNTTKSWYMYIQEYANTLIPDIIFSDVYSSKEEMLYKLLFRKYFPNYKLKIKMWLPKWTDSKDPSGRLLPAFLRS